MTRNTRLNAVVRLVALAATVVLGSSRAEAQKVPFKVTGGGTAPIGLSVLGEDSPHNATGEATYLGQYSGNEGIFNAISFLDGTFEGSFVFVAADGDRLAFTYGDTDNGADSPGVFFPVPVDGGKFIVVFCAEFNPIPEESTGRFADVVDGSFTMLAMTEPIDLVIDEFGFTPPFEYTWEGEGWIEFDR